MTRTLTLVASLGIALSSIAQDHRHSGDRCKAHDLTERFLMERGLPADISAALPSMDLEQRGGGNYIIPVVFHVVWNTQAENIPNSAIQAVVNQMNQDYSASNSNLSSVRSTFQSVIDNVGFEFCLAQFDPQGNPSNGITRTQTSTTWFNPDTQPNAMKAPPAGKSPWDPTKYLNIWVCDIHSGQGGGGITLGYAYLPVGGVVGTNIDGLVVDYLYGMALSSRTTTHEVGHYFGLEHPWGGGNGSCGADDGFTDTPNTDSPTFSCANSNLVKCGVLTQYENFMDYSNCAAMFTNQQGNYMAGILNGVRSSLLTSSGCASVPVGYCVPSSTNGTADGDFVNSVVLGSINNTNSGGAGQPTYSNFTGQWSTSLQRGNTYTITVQSGTYQPNALAAWIDYDQNQAFAASEKLGEINTTVSGQTTNFTFTVPMGATLGTTRLRVRSVFVNTGEPNPADPCFNYAWGETEDYGITITGAGAGVCIPTSLNGTSDGDFINGVSLGSIVNTNSGAVDGPTYTDYSGVYNTTLVRGSSYTITIQGGTYFPDQYAAWIDLDQNNVFAASEKLGEWTSNAVGQTQGITFTVPVGAALGSTRLRVRGVYHNTGEPSPTDPCFDYAWGETEDYSVTITTTTGLGSVEGSLFAVFPNPASDRVTVQLPDEAPAYMELFDMQGRRVDDRVLQGSRTDVPVHGLAAGHYVVRIVQDGEQGVLRLEVLGTGR